MFFHNHKKHRYFCVHHRGLISEPMPPVYIIETSCKDSLCLSLELSTQSACNNEKEKKNERKQSKLQSLVLYIKVIMETIRQKKWKRHARAVHLTMPSKRKGTQIIYTILYQRPPYLKTGILLCIVAHGPLKHLLSKLKGINSV